MSPVALLLLPECLVVGSLLVVRGVRHADTLPNPFAMICIGLAVIGIGVVGPLLGWT